MRDRKADWARTPQKFFDLLRSTHTTNFDAMNTRFHTALFFNMCCHVLEDLRLRYTCDPVGWFTQIEGYRCLSLMRVVGVVNCQFAFV